MGATVVGEREARVGKLGKGVSIKKDWWALLLLLALVGGRLAFASLVYARPELALANDSDRYVPIANTIVSGTAYQWNTDRPGELLNTVGYPLFLAGVFVLRGHASGDVAFAQLILSGLIVLLMYFGLKELTGNPAALISAVLLAIDPLSILWSMTVLTETLFAAMLAVSVLLLAHWALTQNRLALLAAGLFAGLACLVRPIALPLAGLWALGLVLFPRGAERRRKSGGIAASLRVLTFAAPILVLVVPWVVRNALLWNCPTLSSVDRVTMRDYVAAKVISQFDHITLDQAQARLQAADPDVCPRATATYLNIILQHPAIYAQQHLGGTISLLFSTSFDRWLQFLGVHYSLPDLWGPFMDGGPAGVGRVLVEEIQDHPGPMSLMLGLTAFQLLLYGLAILGVASVTRSDAGPQRWIVVILVLTVLFLTLTPGQSGHERFRVPVQPMLIMLAAYGISSRLAARQHRKEVRAEDGAARA